MTDPQAAREQIVRAQAQALWDLLEGARPFIGPLKDLPAKAIMELIASTEVRALEEATTRIESLAGELTPEQADGCGNYDDVGNAASNDTCRYIANWLEQQAQERTP